jgi:hypothetical protein
MSESARDRLGVSRPNRSRASLGTLLALALLEAALLGATSAHAQEPGSAAARDACFFDTLTSVEWFTFGAPDGEVSLSERRLRLRADKGFGDGGRVGAIWRRPVRRPASGKRYVYVWHVMDATLWRPGRAHLVLKPEAAALTPMGGRDWFGAAFDVAASGRRVANLLLRGKRVGYHLLPKTGPLDVRFVLTADSLQAEIKSSEREQWVRLPTPDNPWRDGGADTLYLHLETCGDPSGRASSHYSVAGVEISDKDLSQPSQPILPAPEP